LPFPPWVAWGESTRPGRCSHSTVAWMFNFARPGPWARRALPLYVGYNRDAFGKTDSPDVAGNRLGKKKRNSVARPGKPPRPRGFRGFASALPGKGGDASSGGCVRHWDRAPSSKVNWGGRAQGPAEAWTPADKLAGWAYLGCKAGVAFHLSGGFVHRGPRSPRSASFVRRAVEGRGDGPGGLKGRAHCGGRLCPRTRARAFCDCASLHSGPRSLKGGPGKTPGMRNGARKTRLRGEP